MKRLALLLLLVLPGIVGAEDLSALSCEGRQIAVKEALDLVAKTQSAYRNISGFSAEFVQVSYLSALEMTEKSAGRMSYSRPGKLKWEYSSPHEQLFVSDANNIWFYQKEEKQVVVDKASGFFDSGLPVSFLLGVGSLQKDFKLNFACPARSGVLLDLSPAREDQGLSRFKLLINTNYLPIGAEVTDPTGNRTSFLLINWQSKDSFADGYFEFKLPEGVDLIDRRAPAKP